MPIQTIKNMGLVLTNTQSNDAKILYLTDQSTWDDGTLADWSTVTAASLSLSYKTPDVPGGTAVYAKDVTSVFTGASTVDDLVFEVTSTDVGLGSNVALPDGIWTIGYDVTDANGSHTFESDLEILLDATVKSDVYKKVASISYLYYAANNYYTKQIDDIHLLKALYDSMIASAYVAKQEEILDILDVLQRLTSD